MQINLSKNQVWATLTAVFACAVSFSIWLHQMWIEQIKLQEIQKYQTTAIVDSLEKTNSSIKEFSRIVANHETRISVLESKK